MPELPEVETVRRSLLPHVLGRRIEGLTVRETRLREPLRTAELRRQLIGRQIVGLRRRAKYLLFDLCSQSTLMVHLGMSGRLGLVPAASPPVRHDHVLWALGDGRALCFHDPRRFGLVCWFARAQEAAHPRLVHLGVEPLDSAAFTGAGFYAASRGCRQPIKSYLMDASRQVGIGNIYACEALWAAGIHPQRAAGRLGPGRCLRLVEAVRTVLQDAIALGGTTLRDFLDARGSAGLFAPRLCVYGRTGQSCRRCGASLRRLVQAGRSTFYCPACQR